MRQFVVSAVVALMFVFSVSTASAFETSIFVDGPSSAEIGDTMDIVVDFSTVGDDPYVGIELVSVSVLFNTSLVTYNQQSSLTPSYALYVSGGKGNAYLLPATTNLTLRANTNDQILMDWQNSSLPGGNRDRCGNYLFEGVSELECGFTMAILNFTAISNGLANFDLSNSSPGNILQLSDGSRPENVLAGTGSVSIQIPEPTAASLSIFALLSMAGLRIRAKRS
ncbi:MAG: hypothetical protein ACJZ7Z_01250 [Myxococcota bacterium]